MSGDGGWVYRPIGGWKCAWVGGDLGFGMEYVGCVFAIQISVLWVVGG